MDGRARLGRHYGNSRFKELGTQLNFELPPSCEREERDFCLSRPKEVNGGRRKLAGRSWLRVPAVSVGIGICSNERRADIRLQTRGESQFRPT